LVTIAPAAWLVVCTVTAGLEKVFSPNPNIGFISHALKYGNAIAAGQLLAPAQDGGGGDPDRRQRLHRCDACRGIRARRGRYRAVWPDQHLEGAGHSAADRDGNRAWWCGRGKRPCLTCRTCSIARHGRPAPRSIGPHERRA